MKRRWQSLRWRMLRIVDRVSAPLLWLIVGGLATLALWLLYQGYTSFLEFLVSEPLS